MATSSSEVPGCSFLSQWRGKQSPVFGLLPWEVGWRPFVLEEGVGEGPVSVSPASLPPNPGSGFWTGQLGARAGPSTEQTLEIQQKAGVESFCGLAHPQAVSFLLVPQHRALHCAGASPGAEERRA